MPTESKINWGLLYLCGTPIGNLEDITLRALRVLKEVDLIAAEDTRHTRKLLSYYNIHTPLTSYHEHNKKTKGPQLISELREGKNIALVSDAGMPGISDPGEELVLLAVEENIRVIPIPGPSAVVTALVSSGLPAGSFAFEGFLPRLKKDRVNLIKAMTGEKRTVIFYESPHRIKKTLKELLDLAGDRKVTLGRELTKVHEEFMRGTISQLLEVFQQKEPRGEFTVVLEGSKVDTREDVQPDEADVYQFVSRLLAKGMNKKEAMKETARALKISKREVYNVILTAENKK